MKKFCKDARPYLPEATWAVLLIDIPPNVNVTTSALPGLGCRDWCYYYSFLTVTEAEYWKYPDTKIKNIFYVLVPDPTGPNCSPKCNSQNLTQDDARKVMMSRALLDLKMNPFMYRNKNVG
ncbi:hypothetical protein HDV05_005624, partial [Chytridiales sp. JEL 0842]